MITKDQELCRMESIMNSSWQDFLDEFLVDKKTINVLLESNELIMQMLENLEPISTVSLKLLALASMKLLFEARRRDLIPKQNGVEDL